MKKLTLGIVCLLSGVFSHAGDYPENPDRMTSIGVNYHGFSHTGTATTVVSPLKANQDIEIEGGTLIADIRLPVSNSTTLNFALGYQGGTTEAKETNLLAGGESDTDGITFTIGARFYIR